MRRFWRSLFTWTILGATVGTYMYFRSRRQARLEEMGEAAGMARTTRRAASRIIRSADRLQDKVMAGTQKAGLRAFGLGRRLGLGKVE